jgi:HK97 gp10 family phage protein
MPLPKSNMKINRRGIQYTSNIDQASYTIKELSRAALRDVSRMIRYKVTAKLRTLPGLKKGKRAKNTVGSWLRKIEGDLQLGMGNTKWGKSGDSWYAMQAELGTHSQPKRGFLKETVMENIPEIIKIESQYLSAISGEDAQRLIDESEEIE